MSHPELDWLAAHQPQHLTTDEGARERARVALARHAGPRSRSRGRSHRRHVRRLGVMAAAGAAGVAAAAVVTAGAQRGVGAGAGHAGAARLRAQASGRVIAPHRAPTSPLVRLADYVTASAAPAGDATLVARTTMWGTQHVTVYDLYADDGQYFFSRDSRGLPAQVAGHHNQAGGLFAREI